MILIVRGQSGLKVLRPSKLNWKVNSSKQGTRWENVLERDGTCQLYPQEAVIPPGAHVVERIENPFVPGGEPWLVLKRSRIGAAEAYIKRLCAATQGAGNAVELVTEKASVNPAGHGRTKLADFQTLDTAHAARGPQT